MMIAIVRNNLACLISKHNSFVCKSLVSSAHFYSTDQNAICPRIYDLLLHKHNHFSAELSSLVASGRPKSPENADSILSFLKESCCSTTQLEKFVKYNPRILSHSIDDIKLKIKIFQDLWLSPEEIAKMQILGILESKKLIKWPDLATMCTLSEDKFFERFVRPYPNEVGEAFVTKREKISPGLKQQSLGKSRK